MAGFAKVLQDGTDAVLQMDADLSHDPRKIPEMVAALRQADVVLGSRYIPGGSLDSDWSWWRRGLSHSAIDMLGPYLLSRLRRHHRISIVRASTLSGMPLERSSRAATYSWWKWPTSPTASSTVSARFRSLLRAPARKIQDVTGHPGRPRSGSGRSGGTIASSADEAPARFAEESLQKRLAQPSP
jgi:hypothetical protein